MDEVVEALKQTKKHLLTGTSYMLPVVAGGGIIFAVAVLLGGGSKVPTAGFPGALASIGSAGLTMFVPVLAAYIAYSMAGRTGLGPGIIAGWVAMNIGTGFLGALLGGILAGVVVILLKQIKLPPSFASLLTMVIIPVFGTAITGLILHYVLGAPIRWLTEWLNHFLGSLSGGSLILLGLVFAAAEAVDLGGPVNKTAFVTAIALGDQHIYLPLAAVAAGAVTPPIGMGISTFLARHKFTAPMRQQGTTAIFLGLCSVSEGAIPFVAKDPLRATASNILGSAVAGIVVGLFAIQNTISWGGMLVLPGVNRPVFYLLAILVGSLVTAGLYMVIKKPLDENEDKLLA